MSNNINYFTTLRPITENGLKEYVNTVYIDDKKASATLGQTISDANACIKKDGVFNGHTGNFQWLVSAYIPRQSDDDIKKPWVLNDITKLSVDGAQANDFPGAFYQPVDKVSATIGHIRYDVPYIEDIQEPKQVTNVAFSGT